jgi:hypothetical protein
MPAAGDPGLICSILEIGSSVMNQSFAVDLTCVPPRGKRVHLRITRLRKIDKDRQQQQCCNKRGGEVDNDCHPVTELDKP